MDAPVGEVPPKAKMTRASMLQAPMLAFVNLGFLNRLALRLRERGLINILSLQAILSLTYDPLNRLIQMKYTNAPYESHKPLYVLNAVSYMVIITCFISLFGIIFLGVDGLPRDSSTYLHLRVALLGAIVMAPVSLASVYFTPSEYVGAVTICTILVVLILGLCYVKVRGMKTTKKSLSMLK